MLYNKINPNTVQSFSFTFERQWRSAKSADKAVTVDQTRRNTIMNEKQKHRLESQRETGHDGHADKKRNLAATSAGAEEHHHWTPKVE